VIIACKKKDAESLQKYLFRLKYYWIDFTTGINTNDSKKHRHIKNFNNKFITENYIYFIIFNDTFTCSFYKPSVYKDNKKNTISCISTIYKKRKTSKTEQCLNFVT